MSWTGWVVVEVGQWRYILGGWTIFRVGCGRWRYILGEWGGWRFSITPTKNVSVKKCKS